jgi:hypothetical protein
VTRRSAVLATSVLLTVLAAGAAATPASAQTLPGTTCSFFRANNILNADISALPVNSQSSNWMSNMTQNTNLHPDLGTFAQWYGIPINVAPPPTSGVPPTFLYNSESDHPTEGYPIDQNTAIEGGPSASSSSDRHALVVNKNLCKLYEIYNLQNFTNGQTPQAGSGAVWDLASNSMRPNGWTSADAAGLPIAPLLLRPDEILVGSITHAIRFTTHCTHSYIWPASHDAGLCATGFPPMGARFRLRSGFNISGFSPTTQIVLRAFQHYGLILADNGADWFFQGTTDDWWGTAAGSAVVSELKTIPAAQFDAVDESSLQAAANSYQVADNAPKGCAVLGGGPLVADYSGDGRSDMAFIQSTGVCVLLSTGTSFAQPAWPATGAFYGSRATLAGDVNGDGKADLVAVNQVQTFVMTSTGSGFSVPSVWSNVPFYGTRGTFLADVNGDGKADLVAVNGSSVWVMPSTGTAFGPPTPWSSIPFFGNMTTLVGDVNGDGRADVIAVNRGSTWVMTSTGSAFSAPALWSSTPFYGERLTLAADVNGDGKADLVAVNNGSTWVMASTGSAFGAPALWLGVPFWGSSGTALGDVNGDRAADLVALSVLQVWVATSTGSSFAGPAVWF